MNIFKELSIREIKAILKFPAYISILAAFRDNKLEEGEKKAAVKFAHAQTFVCDPMLTEFYQQANKVFEHNIEQIDRDLPRELERREAAIKEELKKIEKIMLKLGNDFASAMNRSMNLFTEHMSKAHYNVLNDFVFPLNALGLGE